MSNHTPDADYLHGAAEALAHIAERIANAADDFDTDTLTTLRLILESTAAELGLDEEAPPNAPQTVDEAHCDTCGGPCRDESDLEDDEEGRERPLRSTETASRSTGVSVSTPDRSKPAEIESGRFEIEGVITRTGAASIAAYDTRCQGWYPILNEPTDLAELVQRAAEHAEVCK